MLTAVGPTTFTAGGADVVPASRRVQAIDGALARLLAHEFPGDELVVPHRVFAVVARRPRAATLVLPRRRWVWARHCVAALQVWIP